MIHTYFIVSANEENITNFPLFPKSSVFIFLIHKKHVGNVSILLLSDPKVDISHDQLALVQKLCIVGPRPLQLWPERDHLQSIR